MKTDLQFFTLAREGAVAKLVMNRPDKANGMTPEFWAELPQIVRELDADPTVRTLVIAGAGRHFTGGMDLASFQQIMHLVQKEPGRAAFALRQLILTLQDSFNALEASRLPVIAAVHATATAAGCQLVATSDLAIAADTARFCTPGVNIGLFCSTPMVALSRNVPRKRAMEMLLLGDMMDASDAVLYGLVNRAVPATDVLDAALEMAQRVAAKSPATVAIGKAAFYAQIEKPLADAYAYAAEVMVENMMYRDAAEGIGAFIEKRKPTWKGC